MNMVDVTSVDNTPERKSRLEARVVTEGNEAQVLIGFVNPRVTTDGVPFVAFTLESYLQMAADLHSHAQQVLKNWENEEPLRRARSIGLVLPDGH